MHGNYPHVDPVDRSCAENSVVSAVVVQDWLHARSEPKYGGPTDVKSWCEAVK
jgi:hypothetical protein